MIAKMLSTPIHGQSTVVYSGAGLSKGAGIADYASRVPGSISGAGAPRLASPLEARPTKAHYVLAAMFARGLVHEFVNQNHDGLAEKAGVPQSAVNEIHGAWFDVSNPVVQFNQSLRTDLFNRLLETEKNATMVLCLGTSLSGMNADRVAVSAAERFVREQRGLGTVIVNLQKTTLDSLASVRIWGRIDDVMTRIARHLELEWESLAEPKPPRGFSPITLVPYDVEGKRLRNGSMRVLDTTVGAPVICGWKDREFSGVIDHIDQDGHVFVVLRRPGKLARMSALGRWWIDDAMRGVADGPRLPLRSVNAETLQPTYAVAKLTFACEMTEEKKWDWRVRVDPTLLPIKSVRYQLHETFVPPTVTCLPSEELHRVGWGYFDIPVMITFEDDSTLGYTFQMTFDEARKEIALPLSMREV